MSKNLTLIILPTKNRSPLVLSTNQYGGLFDSRYYSPMTDMGDRYQHLYILSDDQINAGDWYVENESKFGGNYGIYKCFSQGDFKSGSKKIICSTDESLELIPISSKIIRCFIKQYNQGNTTVVIKESDLKENSDVGFYALLLLVISVILGVLSLWL